MIDFDPNALIALRDSYHCLVKDVTCVATEPEEEPLTIKQYQDASVQTNLDDSLKEPGSFACNAFAQTDGIWW